MITFQRDFDYKATYGRILFIVTLWGHCSLPAVYMDIHTAVNKQEKKVVC